MIKFFRNIRRKLLTNNKLAKYLVYAVGEIVLIVLGILIALNLNNRNEQRQAEARIELILNDLMTELLADIEETRMPMNYFARRDSTIQLVLTDRVTFEDYAQGRIPYLNNLIRFYNRVNLTQKAYDNLIREMDAVPDQYQPLIKELDQLYNYNKTFVEETNEQLSDFIEENQLYGMRNYPWFYSRNQAEWEQSITFKLEDFRYKNQVNEYQNNGTYNQLRMSLMYRRKAIECYELVASLLNKPADHESFYFDPEIASQLVGEWYVENEPEIIYSFYLESQRLYVKTNVGNNEYEVWHLPRLNKILHENLNYGTLVEEDDQLVIKYNYWNLRRKA